MKVVQRLVDLGDGRYGLQERVEGEPAWMAEAINRVKSSPEYRELMRNAARRIQARFDEGRGA